MNGDDASDADDPAVLHIGGDRGRRLRSLAAWASGTAVVAAVLVGFFVWFGSSVGWAVALVAVMVGYMALMARWSGGGGDRPHGGF